RSSSRLAAPRTASSWTFSRTDPPDITGTWQNPAIARGFVCLTERMVKAAPCARVAPEQAREPGSQKRRQLRLRGFDRFFRSFSLNSYGYSPQMIEKPVLKRPCLTHLVPTAVS